MNNEFDVEMYNNEIEIDFELYPKGPKGDPGPQGDPGPKGDPGNPGATGNGIASIVKTDTSGLIDTYTITFTDGTTTSFQVTNGQDGYTPQRGTDYWTSSDILAIESYCNNYIDTHVTQVLGGSY